MIPFYFGRTCRHMKEGLGMTRFRCMKEFWFKLSLGCREIYRSKNFQNYQLLDTKKPSPKKGEGNKKKVTKQILKFLLCQFM